MKKNINILLTEVLPFEIPFFFTNKPLISIVESMDSQDYNKLIENGSYIANKATIPLNFYSFKNDSKKRILSVPHFISQLNFLFFLEKYNKNLLNYFSLNTFYSIRIPKKISSQKYRYLNLQENLQEILSTNDNSTGVEEHLDNDKKYKNFFYNGKYTKLSSFYDSSLLKKLEKQFSLVLKLDIKKCFYNIYTHSIDWAYLGDKKTAKAFKNSKNRISSTLDNILQNSNNGETNGIIVGPEFSRIAAEIVLSKIDNYLFLKLKDHNLKNNKNYFIVRYIDDFFIFSNNEQHLNLIQSCLEEILEQFKLSINDSKKSIEHKPFFKEQFWVYKLSKGISNFYSSLSEEKNLVGFNKELEKHFLKTRFVNSIFNKLTLEIKDLIVTYPNNDYKIISYFLSAFDFKLYFNNSSDFEIKFSNPALFEELNILISAKLIELFTYIINFSLTATNIFKLFNLLKKFKDLEIQSKQEIEFIIFSKIEELINYNITKAQEINLLISFLKFYDYNIKQQIFSKILEKNNDYFTIVTILFYLNTSQRKNKKYKLLFIKINLILESKFKEIEFEQNPNILNNSEYMYLIHDLSFNNSFIEIKELSETIKKIKTKATELSMLCHTYKKIYDSQITFTDWNLSEEEFEKCIVKEYQNNTYE
ncbi:MAG: RNA-directed DNA polymerase [Cetobacterium sp.]